MSGNFVRTSSGFVRLDATVCHDPVQAAAHEWWLANGIGGYAGGTVAEVLTRRYHGLLVAPLHPPLGRWLLMVKADAVLLDGTQAIPLHSNQWPSGVRVPDHCPHIDAFYLDGAMPVWHYSVSSLRLEKRVWMEHGENQTHVACRWMAGQWPVTPRLRLDLIASYRDHHYVNQINGFWIQPEVISNGLRLHLPAGESLEITGSGAEVTPDQTWIENFSLALEQERGLEDIDHHLRVGCIELPLQRDAWVGITIGPGAAGKGDLQQALQREQARSRALQTSALPGVDCATVPDWIRQLVVAADSYLFTRVSAGRPGRRSVIAGYPWFGDWGRDTMIALPGLTLATGRGEIAHDILMTFAGYVNEGMLPNVFPGDGETPEYNTVDAALWFIEAWRAWWQATGDVAALRQVWPVLGDIIEAYRDGTRFGIAMDPADGLMRAGVPGQQLTWMDARVDGREVTPRHGKPVEISALWYNALCAMRELARALGEPTWSFDALISITAGGFARYRRGDQQGLYDVLDGPHGHDASIRPNQIFAVSLPYSPLTPEAKQAVLAECRAHLLTPYGLRSLAPHEPGYAGRYTGGVHERDSSYHQGPVWGWLLGHYALAEYQVEGDARAAQQRLSAMAGQLLQAGLGHISEIFDGDPPHAPRGAPAQAWSVACTLEAWWRLQRARHLEPQGS